MEIILQKRCGMGDVRLSQTCRTERYGMGQPSACPTSRPSSGICAIVCRFSRRKKGRQKSKPRILLPFTRLRRQELERREPGRGKRKGEGKPEHWRDRCNERKADAAIWAEVRDHHKDRLAEAFWTGWSSGSRIHQRDEKPARVSQPSGKLLQPPSPGARPLGGGVDR